MGASGQIEGRLVRGKLSQRVQSVRMRHLLVEQFDEHVALRRQLRSTTSSTGVDRDVQSLEGRLHRRGRSVRFGGHCERQSDASGRSHFKRQVPATRMAERHVAFFGVGSEFGADRSPDRVAEGLRRETRPGGDRRASGKEFGGGTTPDA